MIFVLFISKLLQRSNKVIDWKKNLDKIDAMPSLTTESPGDGAF